MPNFNVFDGNSVAVDAGPAAARTRRAHNPHTIQRRAARRLIALHLALDRCWFPNLHDITARLLGEGNPFVWRRFRSPGYAWSWWIFDVKSGVLNDMGEDAEYLAGVIDVILFDIERDHGLLQPQELPGASGRHHTEH